MANYYEQLNQEPERHSAPESTTDEQDAVALLLRVMREHWQRKERMQIKVPTYVHNKHSFREWLQTFKRMVGSHYGRRENPRLCG